MLLYLFSSIRKYLLTLISHNKSSSENSMNRFTLMSQKDSGSSHIKSKHCRSNSIKSNHHSIGKKIPVSMKMYEKILTQTTSRYKRSQQLTPKRSCSTGKKSKVDKTLNDSKTLKNARKGGLEKEKLFMAQSLNIPNIESFVNEDYMRNSSQQLSTNNMERSINLPLSLAEILSRTQSVCQSYEKTCKSM